MARSARGQTNKNIGRLTSAWSRRAAAARSCHRGAQLKSVVRQRTHAMTEKPRFMYHSFPRRRSGEDSDTKGLSILKLIASNGLLLTPEIEHWRDSKTPPSPPEDYIAVSRRCCFTELAPDDLQKHAGYFGNFALEFDQRTLVDLGAMPVFYVPRTTGTDGYGPGPALVTQLAHAQELLARVTAFRKFSQAVGEMHPSAQILASAGINGGLVLGVPGSDVSYSIPADVVARAKKVNPSFDFVAPSSPTPLGLTAGTLLSIFNLLHWGIHDPDVLTGTIKALGSLFYSTERPDDPFLSHYQQREWRIIGGMKRDGIPLSRSLPIEMRRALIDLDAPFFQWMLPFPSGSKALVDECEVFGFPQDGTSILSRVRRAVVPERAMNEAAAILHESGVEVVSLESLAATSVSAA